MIERIKNKIVRTSQDLIFKLGLERLILGSKKGAVVLCYHGVDLVGDKTLNMRFYSIKRLEYQFKIFKKYFNVISISDYFDGKFDKNKYNLAITFDDGYFNNYKYLKPIVEKYQLPISIYITGINNTPYNYLWPDFIDIISLYSEVNSFKIHEHEFVKRHQTFYDSNGDTVHTFLRNEGSWKVKEEFFKLFNNEFEEIISKKNIDDYWKLMTDDDIKKISFSNYITIGSHGYYHNNLSNVATKDAKNELKLSKEYLENILQKEVDQIAYPDGSYTRKVLDVAMDLGFKYQLAIDYKFPDDREDMRLINRFGMYPVYSVYNELANLPEKI